MCACVDWKWAYFCDEAVDYYVTKMMSADNENLQQRLATIERASAVEIKGRVSQVVGLTVQVTDFRAPLGAQCDIITRAGRRVGAQLIGFGNQCATLMPLADMDGIAPGDWVNCRAAQPSVPIGPELLGRVINGAGEPIDGKGPLLCQTRRPISSDRIESLRRIRIDSAIGTGIRAIDGMATCGCGQRLGIFSGPGVGKSVLLGMIARNTSADVSVIALVGERGREVREFIEKDLGAEGLAKSVVVVSTSDEPAPLRVRACFVAAAIAEFFRDQHKDVVLLMDSVTRVAMAQRQIGLALGEPPATRGFTPSVFALLPELIERCGRTSQGTITGFFTVLVEGDDLTEPISDAMRGLLDGHLWLSRDLANRGHYPAIDILESISRVMVDVVDARHLQAARAVTKLVAIYRDIEDLVNIGAYSTGANAQYDLAIAAKDRIDEFLQQQIEEEATFEDSVKRLIALAGSLSAPAAETPAPVRQEQPKQNANNQAPARLQRMMAGV